MRKNNDLTTKLVLPLLLVPLVFVLAARPTVGGQTDGISPEAGTLLRAATGFLAAQQQFAVNTQSTIEAVLHSGQKLQFDHAARLSVQRPDRFRAERIGDLIDQILVYDGQTLALVNPNDGYFATVDAPPTLEAALDFAREKLDIVAPAGDLVYANAYDLLTEDVTQGFVVGPSVVDGVLCHHLAFRSPQADWQLWIQDGEQPLPRKFVITTRDVAQAPQFSVRMTEWDLSPEFDGATFSFSPPPEAQEIEFVLSTPDES